MGNTPRAFIQCGQAIGEPGEAVRITNLPFADSSGLDGGSEGGAFGAFQADDGHAEDVGADLAPDSALAAAAGEADFRGGDAEFGKALETVAEADGDAFDGGAG